MTFEDFDVIGSENCQEDFVDFYDDSGTPKETLIGRYCNSHMPPPVLYSSRNTLTVEFSSTAKTTARGFLLKYTSEKYQLPRQMQTLPVEGKMHLDVTKRKNQIECHFTFH